MAAYLTNRRSREVVTEAEVLADVRNEVFIGEDDEMSDYCIRMYNEITFPEEEEVEAPVDQSGVLNEDKQRDPIPPSYAARKVEAPPDNMGDQFRKNRIQILTGKMRRADIRRAQPGSPMTYKSSSYGAAHRRSLRKTMYLRHLLELESSPTTPGCGKDIRVLVTSDVALTLLWRERTFPNIWFHRDGLYISIQTGQSHQAIVTCRFTERGVAVREVQRFFTRRPSLEVPLGTIQVETRVLVDETTLAEIGSVLATVTSGSGATIQLPFRAAPGSSEWIISIAGRLAQVVEAFSVVVESVQARNNDQENTTQYVPREHPASVLMRCGAFLRTEQRIALFQETEPRDDFPSMLSVPVVEQRSMDGNQMGEENQQDQVDGNSDFPTQSLMEPWECINAPGPATPEQTENGTAVDASLDPDTEVEEDNPTGPSN